MFNLFVVLAMGMWLLNALFKIEALKERSNELIDGLRPCPLCKSRYIDHFKEDKENEFIICNDCGITLYKADLCLGANVVDVWNQQNV